MSHPRRDTLAAVVLRSGIVLKRFGSDTVLRSQGSRNSSPSRRRRTERSVGKGAEQR